MAVTTKGKDPPRASPMMQRENPVKTTGCTDCLKGVVVGHKNTTNRSNRDAQLPGSLLDFDLWKEKPFPTRCGLESSPASFLWESRTTNVDVMSVSNTTRPALTIPRSRNGERRRIHVVLPFGGGAWSSGSGGIGLDNPPVTTVLEAKLSEARRAQRGRDLRRETRAFLSRLAREREDRVSLEVWAATRVQAVFRGFMVRPRPHRPHTRKAITAAESDRRLVADLQAVLARAGLPTIPGLGPDGRKAPESNQWGRERVGLSRGGRGMQRTGHKGGLRRVCSWKYRIFEDEMVTRITKAVRGFIERRRFLRHWTAWDQSRQRKSAVRIQRLWLGCRKRKDCCDLESCVADPAAVKIQALWRGGAKREAIARREREDALRERKTVSATTVQAAVRRRIATARYGPRLTLGAARRKREVRAAAEVSRSRRRRNRGGPTSSATTSSSANRAETSPVGGVSEG